MLQFLLAQTPEVQRSHKVLLPGMVPQSMRWRYAANGAVRPCSDLAVRSAHMRILCFLLYFFAVRQALSWIELLVLVTGQITQPKRQYLLHTVIGCILFFNLIDTDRNANMPRQSLVQYGNYLLCFALESRG